MIKRFSIIFIFVAAFNSGCTLRSLSDGNSSKRLNAVPKITSNTAGTSSNTDVLAAELDDPAAYEALTLGIRASMAPYDSAIEAAIAAYRDGDMITAEEKASLADNSKWGKSEYGSIPRLLIGRIRVAKGRFSEALPLLLKNRGPQPDDDPANEIALCYLKLGNFTEALNNYNPEHLILGMEGKITKEDLPGTATPQQLEASIKLCLADAEYMRGHRRRMLEYELDVLKSYPNHFLAASAAADEFFRTGRYKEAEALYKTALPYAKKLNRVDIKGQIWLCQHKQQASPSP